MKNETNRSSNDTRTVQKKNAAGDTVEVLYQRMGDRWFAFSLIDDEVFVGSLSSDEINGHHPHKAVGNS